MIAADDLCVICRWCESVIREDEPGAPVSHADQLLLARYRYFQRLLTEASDELDAALLAEDADTAAKAGRRLASIGWLLRESADKRDRSNG